MKETKEDLLKELNEYKHELEKIKEINEIKRKEMMKTYKEELKKQLTPEFEDFLESINTPMNNMLGEIYREKLKQILKIINKNGINICI